MYVESPPSSQFNLQGPQGDARPSNQETDLSWDYQGYETEIGLGSDLDDAQIGTQFNTFCRNIKFWVHEDLRRQMPGPSDVQPQNRGNHDRPPHHHRGQRPQPHTRWNMESFKLLDRVKSDGVQMEELLRRPGHTQYIARAFISQVLQEGMFSPPITANKDMWTTEAMAMSLEMIQEEMRERGTPSQFLTS
jgi:hypothetical protein